MTLKFKNILNKQRAEKDWSGATLYPCLFVEQKHPGEKSKSMNPACKKTGIHRNWNKQSMEEKN